MKCPNNGNVNQDGKHYPDEFNQWDNLCQGCYNYEHCIDMKVDNDFKKNPEPDGNTIEKSPSGDNFPNYGILHNRISLNKNRKEMVKKLLNENTPKITKEDITDIIIDIELYNTECRKQKIKERYKRKKEKQHD